MSQLEMSTAQRTRRRAAARAPRNFLIKFTAPCGHRAIVCLKFACGYLLLCLKFAVQCGHSAVLKKILQCSAGTVQEKCARDNSSHNCGMPQIALFLADIFTKREKKRYMVSFLFLFYLNVDNLEAASH